VKLASQPPQAVRTSKELLRRWSRDAALSAAKVEIEQFMAMLRQPEAIEAIAAFTQKRKPDFSRFE
jgi:enoyl-CoA hydratase/carnithine racemase